MKRIIYYLLGMVLTTFGVTSVITADLGAGPFDALFVGLSDMFGLTTGNWLIIICTAVMFLNAILLRGRPDFPAFITIFTQGFLVDFWLEFVFANVILEDMIHQVILFLVGFLVIAAGVVIYLQANFAPNPVDNLMIAINKRFGMNVGKARLLYDTLALVIAFILSGPIFIGTFILAFGLGPVIQVVQGKVRNYL